MSVPDFETKVGDYGKPLTGTLKGPGGTAADLSGHTAKLRMRKRDSEEYVIDGASVTLTDPAAGEFEYFFESPQLEERGTYHAEIIAEGPDGEVTFPSSGDFTIDVNPRL